MRSGSSPTRTLRSAFVPILLSSLLLSCQGEAPKQTFRVGVIVDKTGVMAAHGESIEMGARVAASILNDSAGVLGREVELVVLDGQSDPASTADRTRELIQRYGVQLLLGTGLSSATLAALPITRQLRTPFIYSMDGEAKTCERGDTTRVAPLVWGAGFTERMIVPPFMQHLVDSVLPKKNRSSVYLLGGDYVYPRVTNEYARQVAESLGLRIAGNEFVDVQTRDYSAVIRRIQQANPDVLLITHPGDAAVAFMRQAQQFELTKRMVITGFATFAQEAIMSMGNAAEGVFYANRYSNSLAAPANQAFVQRFRELYPNRPLLPGPSAAAGGYGPLMVAAAAFKKAGSFDSEAFRRAMEGLEIDLPQGHVRVNASNHIFDQHMYLLRIEQQRYTVISDLGLISNPALQGCSVR